MDTEAAMVGKPDSDWLSVAEVALEMRVHINTVYSWLRAGRFKRVRRVQRTIRIHRAELDAPEVKA
jgi:excisionase family DNA binding protein